MPRQKEEGVFRIIGGFEAKLLDKGGAKGRGAFKARVHLRIDHTIAIAQRGKALS